MSVMLYPHDPRRYRSCSSSASRQTRPVAIQSVRTIAQAELQYNSAYPANGFACTLANLGGDPKAGAPDRPGRPAHRACSLHRSEVRLHLQPSPTAARFRSTIRTCYTSFEITAVPQSVGKTGDNGFCSDENNTIRKDPQGATSCTQPIQ